MIEQKIAGDCAASDQWEEAFIAEFHNASFGRMFTGIVHNLNGVNQAFSLQATLFESMFSQVTSLLDQIQALVDPESCPQIAKLQELIRQRSLMVAQMEAKLEEGQSILNRCIPLANLYKASEKGVSLNRIIRYELDILTSVPFFKHGVKKKIALAENIPGVYSFYEEIHTILYTILLNAIEAMAGHDNPELTVETQYHEGKVRIDVINVGDCLFPEIPERIFAPFFSTKDGHLGLGLYLADKYIKRIGGTICPAVHSGNTCFSITFPL